MTKEVKVGALVLVAGILFYFGYHFLTGNDLISSENVYQVRYSNVDGLQVSNPVMFRGLRVGQIEDLEMEHENNDSILVSIRVNENVRVGNKTMVYLESSGMLSGMQLRLETGKSTVLYEGGETLRAYTNKGWMGELEEQGGQIKDLISKIGSMTDKNSDLSKKLNQTLTNIEVTTKHSGHLFGVLDKTLTGQQVNIEAILKNFKIISQEFKTLPDSLKIAISQASSLLNNLDKADYEGLIRDMDSVMVNVHKITDKLALSNNTVGALINEKELYSNLNKTIKDLDFVLVDFQANPKKYTSISVFGKAPENERPIIRSIRPKSISSELTLKLKREIPAMFKVSLYNDGNKSVTKLDETTFTVDRGSKTITIPLPSDLAKGTYMLHATWLGASSGQSVNIEVQ